MDKTVNLKVKTLSQLARISQLLKKSGKKVVLCHGVFDLIHPGHIKHLASAKKNGDCLIVTITGDSYVRKGPGRPIFNENLRAEFLAAITHVDYVAVNNDFSAIPVIKAIKPDFFVKGPDYRKRKNQDGVPRKLGEEEATVLSIGGKLIFTDDVIFSSSKLINDYIESYPKETREFLDAFKDKYTDEIIFDNLLKLKNLKIMVIGDAIIDEYHYCLPMGKSSKEPIIVHKYMSEESFMGGTLATANHLATLSKNIHLVSVLGRKDSHESLIKRFLRPGVAPAFFYRDDENTIIKRRYIDALTKQKLFQISFIKDDFISSKTEAKIISFLKKNLNSFDMVVVNDFGHGMLTDKIIRIICRYSKYIALNVQANSANYGFNVVTKYPKADYVCIDEMEIRLATHDKYSDLDKLIKKVYKKMKCSRMIVTRGASGSLSYSAKEGIISVPSMTQKVVDRVGAGDALFAISAPCEYMAMPGDLVSFIGNVAGAIQVQVVGNKKPVELVDVTKFITRLLK